jgi:hypothetical protein
LGRDERGDHRRHRNQDGDRDAERYLGTTTHTFLQVPNW